MGSKRIMVHDVPCIRWESIAGVSKGTVVYLHGGGLIYGSPYDYPASSLRRFLGAGFDFVSIGYPLAPEASLDDVASTTLDCLVELMHKNVINARCYFAFGRSAGVFLWMMVLAGLSKMRVTMPKAMLALYGYASLVYFDLFQGERGYRNDVHIDADTAFGLVEQAPVYDDRLMSRILLYIFARQHGLLGKMLGVSEADVNEHLLEKELCGVMPPVFAAWSLRDPEVDPSASERLCALALESERFTVDLNQHDFDQNTELDETRRLMDAMISWLTRRAEAIDE